MRFAVLILLFILQIKYPSYAQAYEESNFKRYTKLESGLTDNNIVGIEQDLTGFMWIATTYGLNRFDGTSFKPFLKSDKYNAIPDNVIFSMKLFGKFLTVATDDGAQAISTETLNQINLSVPSSNALRYWSNACLYTGVDRAGNYGISTKTGFYIFSPLGKLINRYDRYTDKDIGKSWMLFGNRIYPSPDGNMMQLNDSGILVYDRNKNLIANASGYFSSFKKLEAQVIKQRTNFFFISTHDLVVLNFEHNSFDITDIRTGNTKTIASCFNLKDELGWQTRPTRIYNNRWAVNSKKNGFFILSIDTIARTISCSPKKYFSSYFCSSVFSDNQNRLWVGTSKGLFMEKQRPKTIHSFAVDSTTKSSFSITSLFITKDKIFAGTNHKEILILNKKTKDIIRRISFPVVPGLSNSITSILPFDRDTFWVASTSGLSWLNIQNYTHGTIEFSKEKNDIPNVSSLYKDSRNNTWILYNKLNSILFYDYQLKRIREISHNEYAGLKTNLVNSVAEDNEGNIWIAGDAISRWNTKSQQIDTLIEYLPTQKTHKKGYSIFNDSKKVLWVCLNDDGFARIGRQSIHIRPENLVTQKNKAAFINLINDKIVISASSGVGYVDVHSLKSIIFHQADGLPSEAISTFNFASDETDRSTWFACGNIICNIPSSGLAYYSKAPLLKINEASVLNHAVINYPWNAIQLKHNQNNIQLLFSAINYTDPENMRFAYRIKNKKDSGWIQAGNRPNILLTNISPGSYNIEVKVYAYDNKWEDQLEELNIIIGQPFWKTPLFLLGMGLLVAGSVYWVYRYRVNQIRQKANLDKLLVQTEMKALHSQMNPHFIFNSLNSIREMILSNENNEASRYLSKFAHLMRITLNQSEKTFVSLRSTIEYLERYIEMEKIRNNMFTCTISSDEALNTDEIFLPPMLIQPFIENAIWHGRPGNHNSIHIQIDFKKENQLLVCTIDDDGIGIDRSLQDKENKVETHQSLGIANIKNRIRLLNEKYNLQSSVVLQDKSIAHRNAVTGTSVTLQLPLRMPEL